MMRNSSYVTHGNQELSKQRIRKLELEDGKDGESKQEYLEPIETKAPPSVPLGDSICLNIAYNKKCSDFDDSVCAQPIIDPIWRIMNKENDTLVQIVSHLSNNACSKVYDVSTALPMVLDLEMLCRCHAWPKSFQKSRPTDNSIGLFFFPENERLFDSLLDDIIERNLVLKAVIDDLELLIFSSLELPQQHWRFRRKYYLWGVFKQTQCSLSLVPIDTVAYRSSTEFVAVPKFKDHIENQDKRDFVKTWTTRSPRSPLSTCSSDVSNMTNSPILPKVESCSPYSSTFSLL
ncbi:unnamed protein product [Ilex paraguariensis]|uniref:AIPP2-like SPOC-like domain-containing protein n=1 Tax=Ilex paraguariensis TaxID=185542 RepID=A0ABC8R436_9AQUA